MRRLATTAMFLLLCGCGLDFLEPPSSSNSGTTPTPPPPPPKSMPPAIAGNYRCTVSAVPVQVDCGGKVLTTNLSGMDEPLQISQTGGSVELGIWGIVLDGNVDTRGNVSASYTDHSCFGCDLNPVHLTFDATAAQSSLSGVTARLWQDNTGYLNCERRYTAVCALGQ